MYLRRKCYSSASNYDYFDYISDLAIAERVFSDSDNRGLGAAIGVGAGGLGLAGLYGYAKSKDKAAANVVNAVKNGEISRKQGNLLLENIVSNDDLNKSVKDLLTLGKSQLTGEKAVNALRAKGLTDKQIQQLFKVKGKKAGTDWMNGVDVKNLLTGTGKANKDLISAVQNAGLSNTEDLLSDSKRELERMNQQFRSSGMKREQMGKDWVDHYRELNDEIDAYTRDLTRKKNGNIADFDKKLKAAEAAEKNTLLKRLRANKKMAGIAGIGGLAGLAGLGYMAGDRK